MLICLGLSDEIRVQYYLYGLRSSSAEYLASLMDRPAGTPGREAVTRFVATLPGRQQLLSLTFGSLAKDWEWPRTRGGNSPLLKDLGHALIGMRFRASKNEWSLWVDIRTASGMHHGTLALARPSFTSGESLVGALKAMSRGADPGKDIILPEYPRLRFKVFPFEAGLSRYGADLRALGHSFKKTAFWYETLRSWPEMLRSEALLPWVFQVDRTQAQPPVE